MNASIRFSRHKISDVHVCVGYERHDRDAAARIRRHAEINITSVSCLSIDGIVCEFAP
jgi:hypothetical protein